MRKIYFCFLLALTTISSCKKEEDGDPHAGHLVVHYAYVRGVVLDSVTGNPVFHTGLYDGVSAMSSGSNPVAMNSGNSAADSTDVNGRYTRKIIWNVGYSYSMGEVNRPDNYTDLYVNGFTNDKFGSIKIKWGVLIENDTITLPNIHIRPDAYICTHIKDTLPSSFGINVYWSTGIGSSQQPVSYNNYYPADTIIYRKACPGLPSTVYWGTTTLHYNVASGDTAFVNVFY